MRHRVPAQALIEQVLLEQAASRPRTRLERLVGRDPLAQDARPWYAGAAGERAVAARLALLPAGWTVLHSLPVGRDGADIDHLVIGPAGVFTISTKHCADASVWVAGRTVLVAGAKQAYVPKAEAEARRVDRIVAGVLGDAPAVQPVVAVVGAKRVTVRRGPHTVAVLDADRLRRWLLAQPERLTRGHVAALVAALDDPRTWQPAEVADAAMLLEFAALSRAVDGAGRARRAWAGVCGLSAFAASLGALWGLASVLH